MVVLPAPFTPTTKITNGLSCFGMIKLRLHGRKISNNSSFKIASSAPLSLSSERVTRSFSFAIIALVASTPTSAINKFASISASKSSSIVFDKDNVENTPPKPLRVRCNCDFKRPYNESTRTPVTGNSGFSTSLSSKNGKSYLL